MRIKLIFLFLITAICVLTRYKEAFASGLVSNWNFEEGSGTIAHDYIGHNDGVIYGAAWVPGKRGSALSFDGVNDYIDIGDVPGLDISSAITLEAWIKTDKIDNDTIISKDDDGDNREYYFGVSYDRNYPGEFRWALKTNGDPLHNVDSATVVNDSLWHYIVGTYDNSYLRLYIDGVEDSRSPVVQTGFIPNTSAPFRIGAMSDIGYEQWFRGVIDEVAVYDRALTADEIRNRFAAPIPEPATVSLLGVGLAGLVFKRRRKCVR